ncbi:alpha/beta hydrolase [Sesbania bispinosa]|nr:alpha/beta hydrolase [Sesbania bispinosa]
MRFPNDLRTDISSGPPRKDHLSISGFSRGPPVSSGGMISSCTLARALTSCLRGAEAVGRTRVPLV